MGVTFSLGVVTGADSRAGRPDPGAAFRSRRERGGSLPDGERKMSTDDQSTIVISINALASPGRVSHKVAPNPLKTLSR